MMDDMIKDSLAGFDVLWQRVEGGCESAATQAPKAAYSPEEVLRSLIREETCAAMNAANLARSCQGDGRALLQRHAADARRHLRRLRAEYFIRTGATPPCPEDCPCGAGRLAALRASYLQAKDLADRYTEAAGHAEPELREVLSSYAEDERCRAKDLRSLLLGSF